MRALSRIRSSMRALYLRQIPHPSISFQTIRHDRLNGDNDIQEEKKDDKSSSSSYNYYSNGLVIIIYACLPLNLH